MRDPELLREYVESGAENAFAEIVRRYLNLAYGVARRQLREAHLAEEVVQLTFCLLARKAGQLSHYESVAGWIYRTTYNLSLKTVRDERKRRDREHAMADLYDQTRAATDEPPWEELVPVLDDALSRLPDADRTALILRYVQNKPMRELGHVLGTSEAAAKMRVGRALDRVRQILHKRGVATSSASLAAALAVLSADAAPAPLAGGVLGAVVARSTPHAFTAGSLVKSLLVMAKLKTKLVFIGCGAAALLLTGGYLLDRVLVFVPRRGNASAAPRPSSNSVQSAVSNASGFVAFSGRMADKLRAAGLARACAKLRAALNSPPRKGTRSYPSAEIEAALASFGPYHAEAFAVLKEALDGTDLEARLQAIAALGKVGKDVPEAKALLWTLLKSGEPRACWHALTSLGDIGFASEDIPDLVALIPGQTDQLLVRYLPEQIARTLQQNPEGMKAQLGSVEALLRNDDPAVRFSGACALAEVRGAQDPEIVKGLAAGLALSDQYRLRHEATGEVVRQIMALETLQRMGPAAKAALPDLQTFAQLTPDSVLREVALRAIGAVDPEAGRVDPEVHSLLARDDQRNGLLERLQAGTWSSEDLVRGLQEPAAVTLAAARLGAMGQSAQDTLPDLQRALGGKDEATRDEILAAIKQINPDYVVPRVARDPVAHGALAAQLELELERAQGVVDEGTAKSLEALINRFRMGNTSWYTPAELSEFKHQLQERNPQIWNAFVAKASEVDAGFETALAQGTK